MRKRKTIKQSVAEMKVYAKLFNPGVKLPEGVEKTKSMSVKKFRKLNGCISDEQD